jgi:hypothetical protein
MLKPGDWLRRNVVYRVAVTTHPGYAALADPLSASRKEG